MGGRDVWSLAYLMGENLNTLGLTYDRVSVDSKYRFLLESVYYKAFVIKRRSLSEYVLLPFFLLQIGSYVLCKKVDSLKKIENRKLRQIGAPL